MLCFKGHYQASEKITFKIGKIFVIVNHILHMDLKFKIYKELLKLNNQN